jgi:glycosyltransferase involved in cell wall biosynthesis
MTTQTDSSCYQRGLELAETGRYEEGLHYIREHLRTEPQDVQALNDAGAILHCLGRTAEAITCLSRARELNSGSGEIVWNLTEAYLGGALASEATALFDDMERLGILSVDVLNRTATMLLDQGKKGQAIDVLLRSRRLWPEQKVLKPILDTIRSKRPKVAFARCGSGDDGALGDICDFVQQRFETRFHVDGPETIAELTRWGDICWLDGGGDTVVEASRRIHRKKIVVSLRCSDVRDHWARQVQWENVDIVVQIGSSAVEEALRCQVPDLRSRTRLVVVPNGVNLSRYLFRRRTRGKSLACTGSLSTEATPVLLLQCMQKLHYLDPHYHLYFSGKFESPSLEQYVRHMVQTLDLGGVVFFEPRPGEMNAWLSDKHFIVAGGIGESHVEALLIGMACGLKPVIHSFPGAAKLFPTRNLFTISEQFCEQVLSPEYEPESYRRFVQEHYPLPLQLKGVDRILSQLEAEIELQSPAGSDSPSGVSQGA